MVTECACAVRPVFFPFFDLKTELNQLGPKKLPQIVAHLLIMVHPLESVHGCVSE